MTSTWRRPWLMLIVSPDDVLRGSVVREAMAGSALDVVQLRHNPATPFDKNTFMRALAALPGLGPIVQPPLYVANLPASSDLIHSVHGMDGVHYPERDLVHLKKQLRHGEPAMFGVSVHSTKSAVAAMAVGATYMQVGTMFPTASHPEKSKVEGPSLMSEIRHLLPHAQLVGVGGIDESNCTEVLRAGANGVAVIRTILQAEDPRQAAQRLRQALDEHQMLFNDHSSR
ncbi:hypothetical protein LEN26_017382 [Aphanomyces euteiches]|nr:hypothetical protein LEN26_017382 [Aphanomyces euteiches]KAH9126681.1 hypothetical protein AeMF1_002902 [Aphanomyces euteiches]KAH9188358.1 hypothetical protein AeNC1_009670 [Aphanomyces euteiches]